MFLDTINRTNPTPRLGIIESTNPCGEQPLLPYESCTLGSINVARCLTVQRGVRVIDYERLAAVVPLAVRFLDNVLDRTTFPIPSIEAQTKLTRKIGLGIMGFADLLIQLGIPYDTDDALEIADRLIQQVPGITGLIDRLQEQSLVERRRGTDDRRVVWVEITDAGLKLLEKLDKPVDDLMNRLMGQLTQPELKSLTMLLERLLSTIPHDKAV